MQVKINITAENQLRKLLKKRGYIFEKDRFTAGKEWLTMPDGTGTYWCLFCGCLKREDEDELSNVTFRLKECEVRLNGKKLIVAIKNQISSVIFT